MSHLGLSNGMVVAVSLNPLASTSFVDPGLQELARGIVVGKYVAILSQISTDQGGNTLADIYFIGPGMPNEDTNYNETESMAIPISPTKEHPDGRDPLVLTGSLPWQKCYVRTVLTERQVRILSVTKKTSSTPQTPRSGSNSSTATLATSVTTVREKHLRSLNEYCSADQGKAGTRQINIPRSDSDSELTRARTRDSDRDSWIEDVEIPSKISLSFDVLFAIPQQLPEPNGLKKEIEDLYVLEERDNSKQRRRGRITAASYTPKQGCELQAEKQSPIPRKRGLLSRIFRALLCLGP